MARTFSESMAGEIKAELARQGKSQTELGRALGLTQRQIYYRLSGRLAISTQELLGIASFLGMPVAQFLPDTTPMDVAS